MHIDMFLIITIITTHHINIFITLWHNKIFISSKWSQMNLGCTSYINYIILQVWATVIAIKGMKKVLKVLAMSCNSHQSLNVSHKAWTPPKTLLSMHSIANTLNIMFNQSLAQFRNLVSRPHIHLNQRIRILGKK